MNDIRYFQKFVTNKNDNKKNIKLNLCVWTYTRVSSKDQFDKNSSVERQLEASQHYVDKKIIRLQKNLVVPMKVEKAILPVKNLHG